jgi:hypothetical protein
MKAPLNLLAILLIFALGSNGQTKKIFHKSHSGHKSTFNEALTNNLFGAAGSNFGTIPRQFMNDARLDSLIAVNDTTVILVTSYCRKNADKKAISKKWKPGREIAYHHPDFYKKNTVERIKSVLKSNYYFVNSPDSVTFIGFAKSTSKKVPAVKNVKK